MMERYKVIPIDPQVVRALTATDKVLPAVCWAVADTLDAGRVVQHPNGRREIYTIKDVALEACYTLNEESCDECGASLADGEGYDGLCGNCADKAERHGRWG